MTTGFVVGAAIVCSADIPVRDVDNARAAVNAVAATQATINIELRLDI